MIVFLSQAVPAVERSSGHISGKVPDLLPECGNSHRILATRLASRDPWYCFRQLPVLGSGLARPLVRFSAIADFGVGVGATPGTVFGNCRFWGRAWRDPWCGFRQLPVLGSGLARPLVRFSAIAGFGVGVKICIRKNGCLKTLAAVSSASRNTTNFRKTTPT